ncbi:MAG: hypothetical protein NVV69_08880 [Methyloversatilis sp.]|uniref:hypothetical protein n=1 Tax=Methyloversatilis sp. TaxID=2569862 RepID=UPI0025ED1BA4|nr:hypothetical protein [Methyloversatilis sp.]MCR6666107.1 hypothetical protein [Methyloversatilis sp.]
MSYSFPAEKFAVARDALMQPHPDGQHVALEKALIECRVGVHRMNRSKLDSTIRSRIFKLEGFMDSTGFSDADGDSAWTVRLKSLSDEERSEIFHLVDDLANFFASQEA